VTDTHTHRHTTTAYTALSKASRGKKIVKIGPVDPEIALLHLNKKKEMEGKIYARSAT